MVCFIASLPKWLGERLIWCGDRIDTIGSTSTAITQNTIETIVRAISTGNSPPQTPYRNTSFSLPTLTKGQTTNLPIDVSNAFIDPNGDPLTYDIKTIDLPSGLAFDKGTNSIIGVPYPQASGS